MRVLIVLLFSTGCTAWTEFPVVQGPGDLVAVNAGEYIGEATLEVRAFAGPLMVKRELCVTDVSIVVDNTADSLLIGEFECVFDELGEVDADFVGNHTGLPEIEGELDANPLIAEWDGWFVDENAFYADMMGDDTARGLRLEYRGFVQAERSGPLPGSSVGL